MPDITPIETEFLKQITSRVEQNMANEQFGVTELAGQMNMSRSNLLRKVKKITDLSVSQFISEVRLKHAMELLKTSTLNVSEISHQVGFNSTSYFIKCFREYYGYPPGEAGKRDEPEAKPTQPKRSNRKRNYFILGASGLGLIVAILLYLYRTSSSFSAPLEKSIAVLPFKNESNDSTNLYLINGLMESTLSNLQRIKDLKVISRTSTEKYRSARKSIPEMAKELHVNYFVEGSGQKIGDRILLNIQLIEASTDKHLWAKQYRREAKDIFELQQEVAKNIAQEIKAIITPEEEKRIRKKPTENLEAYDSFMKGLDLFYNGAKGNNLQKSIPYFEKALTLDDQFALAYANLAMVYYYRDAFQVERKYSDAINYNADKALLLDPKIPEGLVAKGMFYMDKKEYIQAVPYLEKALEYNPNSTLVIQFLSDVYNLYLPNSGKFLEYALKGLQLGVAAQDSVTASITCLHVSNALVQTGFINEAVTYIDKSLAYNPKNPFAGYLKGFILFARDKNLKQTQEIILHELHKDTTRIDILVAIGDVYFLQRDYENAYRYFRKVVDIRSARKLELFQNEDIKIGITFSKMGKQQEAAQLIESYKKFADKDYSIYKNVWLTMYYSYTGETKKSIEHLKLFSEEENYQYWMLLLANDPVADNVKNLPEFKATMKVIEDKFWKRHEALKETLEEEGLL